MNLRIRNTQFTLQIISWIQIIGGVMGLGLMGYIMLQAEAISGGHLLIFLIGIGIFSYSIYCGKRLFSDPGKQTAIILSIINYALQVVQWKMLGYGLSYGSGIELTIGITGFKFNLNFTAFFSSFNMSINSGDDFFIKVNLIAIFMIITLFDILQELKEKQSGIKKSLVSDLVQE